MTTNRLTQDTKTQRVIALATILRQVELTESIDQAFATLGVTYREVKLAQEMNRGGAR